MALAVTSIALIRQPPGLRGPNSYSVFVEMTIDGVSEYQDILWYFYPKNRGLLAVEVYDLIQWDEASKSWISAPIPADSSIMFYKEPSNIYAGLTKDLLGHHTRTESRFIGRVWLRREVLWLLFALSVLTTLWTGTQFAATTRRLRRFKRGLCTRCAYPLPIEDEDPRCPECGTLHKQ